MKAIALTLVLNGRLTSNSFSIKEVQANTRLNIIKPGDSFNHQAFILNHLQDKFL